jgi:hypothetical protein
MNAKLLKILLITYLVVFTFETNAQQLSTKKLHQSKIQLEKVDRISVDRLGGFYVSAACGIEKFDPDGVEKEKYKFRNCVTEEVVEAWNPFRIYAFQKTMRSFKV